jgi:hypothetical protein
VIDLRPASAGLAGTAAIRITLDHVTEETGRLSRAVWA